MTGKQRDCRRFHELIEETLAGEITAEASADLDEHCTACVECASLLDLHTNLLVLGEDVPLPDRHELREFREAVLGATAGRGVPVRDRGFFGDVGHLFNAHPFPAGFATAAVLVGALFLGFWIPRSTSLEKDLIRQSGQWSTAQQTSLDGYWDAPYSFANVSVRPQASGQLALSFDACRHVDVQVAQDSPLAREVLLHAILDPSSMGSRLQAMEATPPIRDGRLKEALIVTMLNDPDPVVRINALGVLAQYPYDASSQDALLQALSQDQDVQVRLTALEELARRNVGQETIRNAVGRDSGPAAQSIFREASMKF